MMMTSYTPPSGIFQDIRAIDELILELVSHPGKARWHWPSYYLLYVDMDRMAWLIRHAGDALSRERPALSPSLEDEEGPTLEEYAECVSGTFDDVWKMQKSIVGRLFQISRGMMTVIEDKTLQWRARAHFYPKSAWYQALYDDYCPGKVSADGRVLERVILTMDRDPPQRIEDLGAPGLLHHQRFDIGTSEARASLQRAVREVGAEHAKTWATMKDHFLAHCTVQDLIHPSSI
jgi:hypothetical protein